MDFASYVHQYYDKGYLVYQEEGEAGKVCADHMNRTVPQEEVGRVLDKLGQSMCNMLEYRDLELIRIQEDKEEADVRYVDMIGPMSKEKSFIAVVKNLTKIADHLNVFQVFSFISSHVQLVMSSILNVAVWNAVADLHTLRKKPALAALTVAARLFTATGRGTSPCIRMVSTFAMEL